MDPEFVFMDNIMPQMIGKISQMLKVYKWDPDTHTLTEEIIGTYKALFM